MLYALKALRDSHFIVDRWRLVVSTSRTTASRLKSFAYFIIIIDSHYAYGMEGSKADELIYSSRESSRA